MSSRSRVLYESVKARLVGKPALKPTAIVVPEYRQISGEYAQPITFAEKRDVFRNDNDFFNAVHSVSDKVRAKGWYVSTDEAADPDGKLRDTLTDILTRIQWGDRRRDRGLTNLFGEIVPELCWGGFSLLEMLSPKNLYAFNRVQLSSLFKWNRDASGNIVSFEQQPSFASGTLDFDNFVSWSWRTTDRNVFGDGMLYPLVAERVDVKGQMVPPMWKIKAQIENDIWRILHRYGTPRSILSFPGLNEDQLKEIAEQVKDPEVDASFAVNVAATVAQDGLGMAANMKSYLEYIDNRIQVGTGTAKTKLTTTTGFTEASAQVAVDETDPAIWDLQQNIKATMDFEIIERLVLQLGYAPSVVKAEFFWGSPNAEIQVSDVMSMKNAGIISPQTAQAILRDQLGWKIPQEEILPEEPVEAPPTNGAAGKPGDSKSK